MNDPPPMYNPTCPLKHKISPAFKLDLSTATPLLRCPEDVLFKEYPKCLYT